MTRTLTTLFFSLLIVTAVAQTGTTTTGKTGRQYKVKDFSEIVIDGGGNLYVYHSDAATVSVNAGKSCLDEIDVSVSEKTLHVILPDTKAEGCHFTIYVGVPVLNKLVQRGGGNVVLQEGFERTNAFYCEIEGGGNIDASRLLVKSFFASINGGGTLSLNAEKELHGKIVNGGFMEYAGDPVLQSDVTGGGVIKKK